MSLLYAVPTIRGLNSTLPWNGKAMGELLVRGPWVTGAYYKQPAGDSHGFYMGFLVTGDVAIIDPEGYVTIVDRSKDLIKVCS